jgi:hypothetical protein
VAGRTGNYIAETYLYLFLGLLMTLLQLFMLDMYSELMNVKCELGSVWKQRIFTLILSIDKGRVIFPVASSTQTTTESTVRPSIARAL